MEWKALYFLSEAKFMAEGGSVGEETLVMIARERAVYGESRIRKTQEAVEAKGASENTQASTCRYYEIS